jgi:transcriptional antiterminator RfaH
MMSDAALSATLPPWFCVRSQPSRQNVAAAHLRSFGVEVFNPHLRVRKATRAGVVWRTEPLFLNYLFARFEFGELHRRVRYAFGVSNLVHFGGRYAELSEVELAPLRMEWGPAETRPVDPELRPGDRVRLSGTLFCGMEAEVLCLLPARQRVRVLLDLLGGPAPTEVSASEIVPVLAHPLATA